MFDELKGKVVLITGASSGIGAAVARAFGRFGAHVGVHYHKGEANAAVVATAIEQAGGKALTLQGDVTRTDDLERIVQTTTGHFGRLDVLINNAGDVLYRSPFDQLTEDMVDSVVDLNARSVVIASRLAVLQFKRQGKGNIITTTSVAARQAGGIGTPIYTAAKSFAQGLTRFLAREYASANIRINAVAPGLIITPLQDRHTTPEQIAEMTGRIPMGRPGTAEDCIGAYLFLATDALSGFITGATIDVNGGQYLS